MANGWVFWWLFDFLVPVTCNLFPNFLVALPGIEPGFED